MKNGDGISTMLGVPMLAAITITAIWRLFTPDGMSKPAMLIYLTAVSATTLLATAFATL